MRDAEIPLQGGRITPGVVRVGQTVRRPPRLTAEFVHALLEHLAAVGFDGAPHFLGTDEKGRDILSYIEGEVPADLGWHKDEGSTSAIRTSCPHQTQRSNDGDFNCSSQPTAMPSTSRRSKKRLFIGRNCWLRKVITRRGPRWRNGPAIAGIGHYRICSACPLKEPDPKRQA